MNYTNLPQGQHTFHVKATDQAGNEDQSPASRTWTVNLAPTVLSATTTESSPGKAWRNTNVTITFSEAMNSATLTNKNIQLFQKGSTKPISSGVAPSSGNTVVTLDPYGTKTTLLAKDTVYTVKVTTAVKDTSGTALAATYTKDFRTGDR